MLKLIVIPARYGSKRLPGKPLRPILGKPLIQWVYEKAYASKKKDGIIVATDDERIKNVVESFGGYAVLTESRMHSGTERVYEAIKDIPAHIIVNLQGDEPFMDPDLIDELFTYLESSSDNMATACTPHIDESEYKSPDCVKVVLDKNGYALYFSRAPIPYVAERKEIRAFKHIGIYAYKKNFLEKYVSMQRGNLEETESLEQLRVLENGEKIKVLVSEYKGFGIDTEEDLMRAEKLLSSGWISCKP